MVRAVLILLVIWIIAIAAAAPLFMYRSLIHYSFNITSLDFKHTISYCQEEWPELPFFDGRVYYSIFSIFVQYFIPIFVVSHRKWTRHNLKPYLIANCTFKVSSAYLKIYFRLRKRFVIAQNAPASDERIQNRLKHRGRRMKRTTCLLIGIALIFGISWLPLNFFNLYADLNQMKMNQRIYIIYGMADAKLFSIISNVSVMPAFSNLSFVWDVIR
jgi:neuropeptide F receptor